MYENLFGEFLSFNETRVRRNISAIKKYECEMNTSVALECLLNYITSLNLS